LSVAAWAALLTTDELLPNKLRPGGRDTVQSVVDGDTVILGNNRQVRLVGIQAPKLPLGRRDFLAWPLADEAKRALEQMVLGKTVTLGYGGRELDVNDRLLAHLHDETGRWIQGEMLSLGMARVYSFPDNTALVTRMLDLEKDARAAKRGIWADPFYRIRDIRDMRQSMGTFQLVEARVERVNIFGGRTYLGFGANEPADFSIVILPADPIAFANAGFMPRQLTGRTVRIRGWVKGDRVPLIEVTHPEQIEIEK
jgi:endonuclease YncB( thermonuclease family)